VTAMTVPFRLRRTFARTRVAVALAAARLRRTPGWTLLAVAGVALAVLSTTLLAGVGLGVVQTGEEKFAAADRDLWVTGGPVRIAPGSVGGFENSIRNAHALAANVSDREDVRSATPLSFQRVYVAPAGNAGDPETAVAVGIPAAGGLEKTNGSGFSQRRVHYAGGDYDGPMVGEVIVGPRVASRHDVAPGDALSVGGTVVGAARNDRSVVGVSPQFSRFLGAPTVVLPLAELQTMTGTAHADTATLLTVSVADDGDPAAVERELEAAYPELDVRTNREQLRSVLADKALVVASGGVLVVLALVAGAALVANLLALLVHQQRRTLAALRAVGVAPSLLVVAMAVQGLLLGALGGSVGLALTVPLAATLDHVAAELVGFGGLVRTPAVVFAVGGAGALTLGTASAAVAALRVARLDPLGTLREE